MLRLLRRWKKERTIRDELLKLTPVELNDLGIGYGDIGRIAREGAADMVP